MIAVTDPSGNPLKYINVRVSKPGQSSEQAIDDRFTDLAGHTAWPGGFVGGDHWSAARLHVNDRNVDPRYTAVSLDVPDLEGQPISVTLDTTGVQPGPTPGKCPDPHDKAAVTDWFFKLANSVGAHTNTVQNRVNMIPGFDQCGVKWQNQNRAYSKTPPDVADMRARFFLNASGPNGDSGFAVDTGDENGPFTLTFRY